MGSDLGLQSSRHHHSKALDEIYKMNAGSRLEQGVEAAPAADEVVEALFFDVFKMSAFSRLLNKALDRFKVCILMR